jgi:hypothetical protein
MRTKSTAVDRGMLLATTKLDLKQIGKGESRFKKDRKRQETNLFGDEWFQSRFFL